MLESRLPGEISVTSDMQMTPPSWQKANKNYFLIAPRQRAGSNKKYIVENHLENKMLNY